MRKQSRLMLWLLLLSATPWALAKPVTIAVISDINGRYGSTEYTPFISKVIDKIAAIKPDVVISTGDMVAGQRKPLLARPEVEAMWTAFHQTLSDPIAKAGLPFAVTPGNHDGANAADFLLERQIFAEQWQPRKPALKYIEATEYPFYYAFVIDKVMFVSLDATVVGALPDSQMRWLEQILKNARINQEKIVLFSHVPLWPFAIARERDYIGDAKLEKMLQKYGVDLYLSGHHHAFYPGHKDGIYYIGQACIGAGPRPLIGTDKVSERSFTLLQIDDDTIRVNAFPENDLITPLNWETLPKAINSKAATLNRADLIDPTIDKQILPIPVK